MSPGVRGSALYGMASARSLMIGCRAHCFACRPFFRPFVVSFFFSLSSQSLFPFPSKTLSPFCKHVDSRAHTQRKTSAHRRMVGPTFHAVCSRAVFSQRHVRKSRQQPRVTFPVWQPEHIVYHDIPLPLPASASALAVAWPGSLGWTRAGLGGALHCG